jgi:tRNA U34 2-thiouridine synthase MnmA/TrmU
MSGGVDSSVAAWLLREQGHDVVGLFMRHGQETGAGDCPNFRPSENGTVPLALPTRHKQGCCTAADAADARRVADMLGIPFYAVNFQAEFDRIVDYFVGQYTAGRTPNPCIVCNTWLKFGKLFEYADSIGAEFVATGHYARVADAPLGRRTEFHSVHVRSDETAPHVPGRSETPSYDSGRSETPSYDPGRSETPSYDPGRSETPSYDPGRSETPSYGLNCGRDAAKDQSYVLFGIPRNLLGRLKFPVGDYSKEEIRQIAGRLGLRVAAKRDSQEICFVPDQDHARFVRQRRGGSLDTSGEIVATDGTVVGRHDGFERFTVGQRKGLRVAFGEPRYVVRIEPESRRVVVGTQEELARRELTASGANWLIEPPRGIIRCQVKIRYRSRAAEAMVEPLPDARFVVRFDEPCYAVAPGQAAVCYDGQHLLGGGWIE